MTNQPNWSLSDDNQTLHVDLPTNPPTRFSWDADAVDDLIANLADMRRVMQPAIPMEPPDPGSRLSIAEHGRWQVVPHGDSIALALLHPGYRWSGILIEPDSAEELANLLLSLAQSPPPQPV